MPDRRSTADTLEQLERVIEQMDTLGIAAEDAAARITNALSGVVGAVPLGERHELVSAIGDVIEIISERSKLSHRAHRLITEIRRHDLSMRTAIAAPPVCQKKV
jgi:hypothetical protein